MNLQIQMIGTGNAFSKKYYNNNALVHADQTRLLIDCGITAPLALHHIGVQPDQLDGIMITHIHGDHVGGLEEIAFRMKYIHKKKPVLYIPEPLIQPLWENTLSGAMINVHEGNDCLESYFEVVPLHEKQPITVGSGLKLEIIRNQHVLNKFSCSVILNDLVFYSSDCTFNRSLLDEIVQDRKCKYILHECQFSSNSAVHTTLNELLTLPEEMQNMVRLMHYSDEKDDFVGKTGKMTFMEQHKIYSFS